MSFSFCSYCHTCPALITVSSKDSIGHFPQYYSGYLTITQFMKLLGTPTISCCSITKLPFTKSIKPGVHLINIFIFFPL